MTSRREFIQSSGLGVIAAVVPGILKADKPLEKHGVSVQLYTIREEIKKDLKDSLQRLAELGYTHVETAFWPDGTSVQLAAAYLKEFGLSVSSSHVEIPTKNNIAALAKDLASYNCKRLIWHGWPEDTRYSSLTGTKELINIYNESSKLAKDNGLSFGLHNHWWEYRNKVGGRLVYEILNEELDQDIFFETDIYWVKVAGQDPEAILKKLKYRIQLIHIKDGPAVYKEEMKNNNPDAMTPLGQGTIDIAGTIAACSDNVKWLVVELDKSTIEVFDALKQSINYLSKFKSVNLG